MLIIHFEYEFIRFALEERVNWHRRVESTNEWKDQNLVFKDISMSIRSEGLLVREYMGHTPYDEAPLNA